MFEITDGPLSGEHRPTENGARMALVNSEKYPEVDSWDSADEHIRAMDPNQEAAEGQEDSERTTPETSETSETENPLFDGPPADPKDVEQDEPECPDCGATDYYDATELLRAGNYSGEHKRLLKDHDHVCVECREVF